MKRNLLFVVMLIMTVAYSYAQNSNGYGDKSVVNSAKDTPTGLPFFDNYDDADVSNYNDLGGATSATSTAYSVFGGNSLLIDGGSFGSGLTRTLNTWPTYISAYVMSPVAIGATSATSYIELSNTNGDPIIMTCIEGTEGPAITTGTGWNGLGSITSGIWYFIEMKIDYNAEETEFFVDGVSIATVGFFGGNTPTAEDCILEFHNYGGESGYWDEVYAYAPKDAPNNPTITDITDVCTYTTQTLVASTLSQWWNAPADGDFMAVSTELEVDLGSNDTTLYANSIVASANNIGVQTEIFAGNVRGYYFTAPTDFVITALFVPLQQTGAQNIEIVRFTDGVPPEYSLTTNEFESLGFWNDLGEYELAMCYIPVSEGDIIGIYGYRDQINSYGDVKYNTHIKDFPVTLYRSGMQFPLEDGSQMHDIYGSVDGTIGNVQFVYIDAVSDRIAGNITLETEAPLATCPDNQVVTTPTANYTVNGTEFDLVSSSDNCAVDYLINDFNSLETLAGAELPAGENLIEWTVFDDAGNSGTCDFTVTVNSTVEINNIALENVNMYPNPSKGYFTVDNAQGFNISITDLTGKIIRTYSNIDENSLTIDFTNEAKGIYLVKISNETNVNVKKIIIE